MRKRGFYDGFPDLVVRMDSMRTAGTYCVYQWTLEGTNAGPDGTGNRVTISGWEYWRMSEDGLVAESRGHFDAEDFEDIIHYYLNNGKIALGKKAIGIGLDQHPNALELKLLKVEDPEKSQFYSPFLVRLKSFEKCHRFFFLF